jgi:serine/threonine-protein kinase
MAAVCAHLQDAPVPPSELVPEIAKELDAIILKCMEKDPEQRFQTMIELGAALRSCEDFGKWAATDAKAWWTRTARRKEDSLIARGEAEETVIAPNPYPQGAISN